MAYPTILQTFILTAVILDLNMAMPTTSEPPPPPCGTCKVHCSTGRGQKCTAYCSDKGLSEVPNECNYVGNLHISDNSVHHITRTTFESFHQLELLKMKNNGIEAIEGGSFAQTRLETVDLSNNVLQSLNKDVFRNLTSLTHVKVANNHIESIPQYNLPNLTYLDMSNNEIREIHRSSFSMMTNIRHLYLSRNHIQQLGNNFLGDMIHLTTLDLSTNEINSINVKAFYFLTSLEKLDLSSNSITDVGIQSPPGALFENQIHLKFLSLSHNQISSLQTYILEGLQKNLTEFSADNNDISTIEADIFNQLKFKNLTKLNLTNNKLDSNFSKEFVPLLKNQATPEITLKGNPLCEEYQIVFKGQYNKTIFCSTKRMEEYLALEQNKTTTDPNLTQIYVPHQQPNQEQETLKIICIISGVILSVLLIILFLVWIKSQNRRTGNYTTCVTNRGYQYPSDRVSQSETPPPIPVRAPLLDDAYANTTTMSSYITPNARSPSANGHPPSINRHSPSTNRHSPSTNRHSPSTNRHSSSTNGHSPSTHRHSPSTHRHPQSTHRHPQSSHRYSFRRSILKRLPSIPHKSDRTIIVIGTTGTSTGTTRIEGLPQGKSVNKKNTSYNHEQPPKPTAKSKEEGAYMIREETEDGKPKNTTMASYRSVQD